jgi:hypothetical protein
MDKNKLTAILPMITPEIIDMLIKERELSYDAAATMLYKSKLYSVLEASDTGLWRLSPQTLYGLLIEELTTGKITFPEEQ